jgi:hypothetical protein
VAAHLGVSEDLVRLIAEDLSDEDGCIIVMGITDEDWTPAFTDQGSCANSSPSSASSISRSRRDTRGPDRMLTEEQWAATVRLGCLPEPARDGNAEQSTGAALRAMGVI